MSYFKYELSKDVHHFTMKGGKKCDITTHEIGEQDYVYLTLFNPTEHPQEGEEPIKGIHYRNVKCGVESIGIGGVLYDEYFGGNEELFAYVKLSQIEELPEWQRDKDIFHEHYCLGDIALEDVVLTAEDFLEYCF